MGLVGKLKQEAASSLKEGEHSSASKTRKIAHQQKLDCYCPTITVLILNCYCLTSPQFFNYIHRNGTPFQARWVSLER
jgi:hypothetical protein